MSLKWPDVPSTAPLAAVAGPQFAHIVDELQDHGVVPSPSAGAGPSSAAPKVDANAAFLEQTKLMLELQTATLTKMFDLKTKEFLGATLTSNNNATGSAGDDVGTPNKRPRTATPSAGAGPSSAAPEFDANAAFLEQFKLMLELQTVTLTKMYDLKTKEFRDDIVATKTEVASVRAVAEAAAAGAKHNSARIDALQKSYNAERRRWESSLDLLKDKIRRGRRVGYN